MADFGAPVADQVQNPVPQAVSTISGLLGLQQQRADIQTAQAEAQQQTQTAQQRAGIANYMRINGAKMIDRDGFISLDKIASDPNYYTAAGDSAAAGLQSLATVRQTQIANANSMRSLDQSSFENLSQDISTLWQSPEVQGDTPAGREQVSDMFNTVSTMNPALANVARIYAPIINNAPPGKLASRLKMMQLQGMAAQGQGAAETPQMVSTGATLKNVAPLATGGPQSFQMTIPPGVSYTTDKAGNIIASNPQYPGYAIVVGGHGTLPIGSRVQYPAPNAAGNQPPAGTQPPANTQQPQASAGGNSGYTPPPTALGASENIQAQALADQKAYTSALNMGNMSPLMKNSLNAISTLSKEVPTGVGSEWLSNAETVLGNYVPGLKGAANDAAKRQMITKYYENIAIPLAQSAFGTDMGKDMVSHSLPDADHMNGPGLRDASKFVATLQMINQAQRTFAANYYKNNGGSSMGYQTAWSNFVQKNLDPRVFDFRQLDTPQERAQWIKSTFGNNRQAAMQFGQKLQNLEDLSGYNYPQQ